MRAGTRCCNLNIIPPAIQLHILLHKRSGCPRRKLLCPSISTSFPMSPTTRPTGRLRWCFLLFFPSGLALLLTLMASIDVFFPSPQQGLAALRPQPRRPRLRHRRHCRLRHHCCRRRRCRRQHRASGSAHNPPEAAGAASAASSRPMHPSTAAFGAHFATLRSAVPCMAGRITSRSSRACARIATCGSAHIAGSLNPLRHLRLHRPCRLHLRALRIP